MAMMWDYAAKANLPNIPFIRVMLRYTRSTDGKPYCLTRVYGVVYKAAFIYAPSRRGLGPPREFANILTLEDVAKYMEGSSCE
jgi:hypothetical protein